MSTKTTSTKKAKSAGPPPSAKPLVKPAARAFCLWVLFVAAWWGMSVGAVLMGLTILPLIPNPLWLLAAGAAVVIVVAVAVHRAHLAWWRARHRAGKTVAPAEHGWWDDLESALRSIAILPTARGEAPALTVRPLGNPVRDERGVQYAVELPRETGKSWRDVAAKQENLAAAMGLDTDRLEISAGKHSGQVRVWVADEREEAGPVTSVMAGATSSVWHEPLRIGETLRGDPVLYTTWGANGLFAGIMGSGKTVAARQVAAHFLLDPSATVHIFDGKGSRADWGAAERACSTFVLGAEDDALATIQETLAGLLALCRQRNAAANPDRDDSWRPDGVLVVVDEVQEILAALPRAERDAMVVMFARGLRVGRAVGVHFIFITQRSTVNDLPGEIRDVLQERVALMARNTAALDFALGDGASRAARHPKKKGEALVAGGGRADVVFTRLDYLTDPAWRAVCEQAAAITPTAPVSLTKAVAAAPVVNPLLAAALAALDESAEGTLSPAELYAALPEALRPTDSTVMGKALTALGVAKKKTNKGVRYGTARPAGAVIAAATVPLSGDASGQAPQGRGDGKDWPHAWDDSGGDGGQRGAVFAPAAPLKTPDRGPGRAGVTGVIPTREQRARVAVCDLRAGQRVRFDGDPDAVTIEAAGIDDDEPGGLARWWVTYSYDGQAGQRDSFASTEHATLA